MGSQWKQHVPMGSFVVIGALIANAILVFISLTTITRGNSRIDQSRQVLSQIETVLSLLKDAETGQRGYLLTGKDEYLTPFLQAQKDLPGALEQLNRLTHDEPTQVERQALLVQKITDKLGELSETIEVRRRRGLSEALELVNTDRGRLAMRAIRSIATEMRTVEDENLGSRIDDSRRAVWSAILVFMITTGIGLVLVGWVGYIKKLEEERTENDAAALRASEAWFSTTLSSIGDAVIATDVDGRIRFLNNVAERLTGYRLEDAVDRPLEDVFKIINEYSRLPVDHPVIKVLSEGTIVGLANHTILIARDGTETPIEDSAAPIRTQDGEIQGVVMVFRDVSLEREAHERLRENDRQFLTLADSIPQLAWMADSEGLILWYNKRWYDYTGKTPEEMFMHSWEVLHDPELLPGVVERFRAAIESGEPWEDTFPLRRHDGAMRWHLSRALPVRDTEGRIVRWFGTNTDVTDQKSYEEDLKQAAEELKIAKEEAEQANTAKDRFLAILSHELRTPLNPILLAVTSMLERPTPEAEVRSNLELIRQYVNLQSRLIDDLLDVMRIVRAKMPLHWEVANAHSLIEQAIQICRSEVFGRRHQLVLELEATHVNINADPARLQQVLWNLIKNAVKFTPEGGTITIRSSNPDDETMLRIEVIDTGIGIEPEVIDLIFDPFQQGETSITRRYGGLGLGLAISKGIIEGHGGSLIALSEGRSRGTTFRIELKTLPPIPDQADPESSDGIANDDSGSLIPLRILLVEDEHATVRLMARLLRGLGHEVEAASTIAEAIRKEESNEFNLIISDIGLPDGSGLDLMRKIADRRGRVPAIALTGYGMEEDIQRSREAGFTAHMTKPIDFSKLELMIRQLAVQSRTYHPEWNSHT